MVSSARCAKEEGVTQLRLDFGGQSWYQCYFESYYRSVVIEESRNCCDSNREIISKMLKWKSQNPIKLANIEGDNLHFKDLVVYICINMCVYAHTHVMHGT